MNAERWRHIADQFRAAELLESELDIDAFMFSPDTAVDWRWLLYPLLGTVAPTLQIEVRPGALVRIDRLAYLEAALVFPEIFRDPRD